MKSSKKDWIIIIIIASIAFLGFFLYESLMFKTEANSAEVIYTPQGTLVTIDFDNKNILVVAEQMNIPANVEKNYPIIEGNLITVLGDYEINNVRQEVVIEVNFEARSVQIIKEESPNHICSELGISTGKPLICLPNSVRVRFVTKLDIDDEF